MVAKSGDFLLLPDAMDHLKNLLLPLCTLVTPNLPEAQALTGQAAQNPEDMLSLAHSVLALNAQAVLLKGGHLNTDTANDL
ncbi:PfkB family carbohydrate kinase, partial [Acinetobacter baumannii]